MTASTKKKSKKTGLIIGIVAAVIIVAVVVIVLLAGKSSSSSDYSSIDEETPTVSSDSLSLDYDTGIKMSDNLFDYQIQIGSTVYQFPMSVENFMKTGLTFDGSEDENELISSGYSNMMWFAYPDGSKFDAHVGNFSKSETAAKNCHVTGVLVATSDDGGELKFDTSKIKIAKNITLGVSTLDDVKNAYGEPSDTYNSDDGSVSLTYSDENLNSVELRFNPSGILSEIDMDNETMPKDVKEEGVSDKIPAAVKSYKKPLTLGNDLTSGVIELEGDLYRVPCPLNEFLNNGWKVYEKDSDTIAGKNSTAVSISKGNVKIENIYIENDEEYEVPLKFGMVNELTSTKFAYGSEGKMSLPKNITVGTSASDVEKAFSGTSVKKETQTGSIKYTLDKDKYSTNVSVNTDDGKVDYVSVYYSPY